MTGKGIPACRLQNCSNGNELGFTNIYVSNLSFPLVGNLPGGRLQTSRSDKSWIMLMNSLIKILTKTTFEEPKVNLMHIG
jgi:hypothetical protein